MQIDYPITIAKMGNATLIEGAKTGCFANVYARMDYADPNFLEHAVACVNALESYNPDAVRDVVGALRDIMRETSAEDDAGENYRSDDPEGALDYAYSTVCKALAELEGGAS